MEDKVFEHFIAKGEPVVHVEMSYINSKRDLKRENNYEEIDFY